MNRVARIVVMPALPALLFFFSLVGTTSFAQAPPRQPGQMTLWQARRAMAAALGIPGIRFSSDGFEYDISSKSKGENVSSTVKIDLVAPPALVANSGSRWCSLKAEADYDPGSLPKNKVISGFLYPVVERSRFRCRCTDSLFTCSNAPSPLLCRLHPEGETFALASTHCVPLPGYRCAPAHLHGAGRGLAGAGDQAPIPEEVRVQRMMAEDSFKANKPDEALHYYETGILLYPTWPEGNFNAALIAGDLGYYAAAIEHMQAYLDLVPDAADAQAARDKILIWQTKAKEK